MIHLTHHFLLLLSQLLLQSYRYPALLLLIINYQLCYQTHYLNKNCAALLPYSQIFFHLSLIHLILRYVVLNVFRRPSNLNLYHTKVIQPIPKAVTSPCDWHISPINSLVSNLMMITLFYVIKVMVTHLTINHQSLRAIILIHHSISVYLNLHLIFSM